MRNKAVLALILALVLIGAGAFLPRIAGATLDRSVSDKIQFAEIGDVQLEFVQSDMPMEEILGILCKGTHSVEVPSDLASHSASDIQRLAQQAISHYQEAGLIPHSIDVTADTHTCVPQLHYQQSSSRKSNIFWNLILEPSDNSWRLEMVLDDRTGSLCSINYDYHWGPEDAAAESLYEDWEAMLLNFRDLFLRDLGDAFVELSTEDISGEIGYSVGEDYTSTTVTWADTIKGECHIVFYIHGSAFNTIFY